MFERADVIVREGAGWSVYSETTPRRRLGGPYRSKAKAHRRLAQVEWFKGHPRADAVCLASGRVVRMDARTKVPRRYRQQLPPRRIEEQYAAALIRLVMGWVRKAYKDLLHRAPKLAAARAERMDSPESHEAQKLVAKAAGTLRQMVNKPAIAAVAKKFAERTSTNQRIQLHDQLHDAVGIDPDGIRDPDMGNRIDDFVRENVGLISSIPGDLHDDVEDLVAEAMRAGRPAGDLAEDIRDRFGVAERHARLIARDQIGKLYADVNHTRQRSLGITRFVWRTVGDERVRGDPDGKYPHAEPSHFDLDGQVFSYDDPPQPPGAAQPILPGDDYQCFPGETAVSSEAPVVVMHRRRYRGEGTVLKTDKGRVLTSTPNHPVLTQRGWIPAQAVNVGDYVIETAAQRVKPTVRDRENRNPMIAEVFRALAPLGAMQTRQTLDGGFHGDASLNEQIDVVDVNRCLRLERNLELSQAFCQDFLARSYRPGLPEGSLDLVLDRVRVPSDSIVRGTSQLLTLLLGCASHSGEHGSTTIAWLHAVADELGADGRTRDVKTLCDAFNTPPVGVEPRYHVARVIFSVWRRAVVQSSRLNTATAEELAQAIAFDTERSGNFGDGASRQQYSCVVEKLRCELDTHVYNLETTSGWYVAQGLIVHNCRCYAEPVYDDLLDDSDDEDDEDDESLFEPDDDDDEDDEDADDTDDDEDQDDDDDQD